MISEQLRLLNFSVFLWSICLSICLSILIFFYQGTHKHNVPRRKFSSVLHSQRNQNRSVYAANKKRFWGNWGNGNTSSIFHLIFCLIWHPIITQNKKYCHSIWGIEKELRIKLIRSDHGRSSWSASCSADILLFSFTIYLSVKMKEMKIM